MGPFPHDAPPAAISAENPMGTDGFEFVEYAHPDPQELHALFKLMGFVPVARHKTKKITVYRQGDVNYLVNEEAGTHGFNFVAAHGPCAPGTAMCEECDEAIGRGEPPLPRMLAVDGQPVPFDAVAYGPLLRPVEAAGAGAPGPP